MGEILSTLYDLHIAMIYCCDYYCYFIIMVFFFSKFCKKQFRVFALHVVAQCSEVLLKGIFKASHLDKLGAVSVKLHETGT